MAVDKMADILAESKGSKGSLISVLQKTQEQFGYLSRENLLRISKHMKVPFAKVYGVATFYAQFHLSPRGRHIIRVCLGTACHVRGGETLLETIARRLDVTPGSTTKDLKFTLERVACLGACGLAPVIMVNDDTYGRLTPARLEQILDSYK